MKTQREVAGRSTNGLPQWNAAEAWTAAQRAEMDSMVGLAAVQAKPGNGPAEAILHRAHAITSVMDKILQQSNPPSHWGINE